MKITIVAPTLNEVEGLKQIMPQIKPEWYDQLIVLDGNSSDGTIDWCKEQGYEVYCQKEKGLWNGYRELFLSGLIKGDIVITFSPDGNSLAGVIPELTKKMEVEAGAGYDLIIASRYLDGATSEDDTKLTRLGNRILTSLVNTRSKFHYTDALVMFRIYRTSIIKQLGFLREPSWMQRQLIKLSGLYSWESSMAVRAGRVGLKIAEVPADEPKALKEGRRQNILRHGFTVLAQIIHEGWLR